MYFNAIRNRADAKKSKGDLKGAYEDLQLAASRGDSKSIRLLKKIHSEMNNE
jgi:hypothetical protein